MDKTAASSSTSTSTPPAGLPFQMPFATPFTAPFGSALEGAGLLKNPLGEALNQLGNFKLPLQTLTQIQGEYLKQASEMWNTAMSADGPPAPADRRFSAPEWKSNPMAAFTAQMYLLNSRALMQLADAVEADEKTRQRIRFAVQQWVDAAAPSNFLALNPEAQRKALETQGKSLAAGVQHLLADIRQGHMSQTDETVFEVGRNVATTEGAVVFENELFQLLEYKPLTAKVHKVPMLFVPPCINKYYILDLQPENSVIRYTVEQGHRVFVVSWRNADESLSHTTWDDYIESGAIEAIRRVQSITGQEQINTLGFCVGGTILSTALAVLAGRNEHPAASLTLLTAFLDFSNTGILDVFIDEAAVRLREYMMGADSPAHGGLLKGQELAATFSFLRPNDLVWNYVVGNYLKGETPPPFDLLYWNSDSTNLPGPMYCWYLRNTYLENKLKDPGAVSVCGTPVDLGLIKAPAYLYASREDHIVPWEGAYANTRILQGAKRFVLGASGHIAGVINPPAKKKRSYWTNAELPAEASEWIEGATEHPGSWWTDWAAWLKPLSGELVAAPKSYGNRTHKPIEPAPGRYVKQKA